LSFFTINVHVEMSFVQVRSLSTRCSEEQLRTVLRVLDEYVKAMFPRLVANRMRWVAVTCLLSGRDVEAAMPGRDFGLARSVARDFLRLRTSVEDLKGSEVRCKTWEGISRRR